jgi:hypothetical protein
VLELGKFVADDGLSVAVVAVGTWNVVVPPWSVYDWALIVAVPIGVADAAAVPQRLNVVLVVLAATTNVEPEAGVTPPGVPSTYVIVTVVAVVSAFPVFGSRTVIV